MVGLPLAALYDPVWTSTVHGSVDFALAHAALALLAVARLPPWAVVGIMLVADCSLTFVSGI